MKENKNQTVQVKVYESKSGEPLGRVDMPLSKWNDYEATLDHHPEGHVTLSEWLSESGREHVLAQDDCSVWLERIETRPLE